jgi:chemotaxis signal transduction protein
MNSAPQTGQRLAAFRLGETLCLCATSNLDAVLPSPDSFRIIPGTKPYFLGNARIGIGRDLVSYFHLPTFLGMATGGLPQTKDDKPTTLILRDPLSSAIIGLQTDEIISFIPVGELKDAGREELIIPAKLTPYCIGVVSAREKFWALIHLDNIIRDPNFRSIELPVQRQ